MRDRTRNAVSWKVEKAMHGERRSDRDLVPIGAGDQRA